LLYEHAVKPVLFSIDAEAAHTVTKLLLRATGPILPSLRVEDERLSQTIFDRTFQNPIGLAAGFDMDAELIGVAERLGFGFTEVGTVTPKPQAGNRRPRLYRFPEQAALQNAMGFNGLGQNTVSSNLSNYPFYIPIGVNIGKNKETSNEDAVKDYMSGVSQFAPKADYLVVNISSPNTPNLRDLQNEEFIKNLFGKIRGKTQKPFLLKISPDLDTNQAVALCQIAIESGAAGIIATNTTTNYELLKPNLPMPIAGKVQGGISGKPLANKSFEILQAIGAELENKAILIAVGGVDSGGEAFRRILAGASLVQLYTGLVYKGPKLIKSINQKLLHLLKNNDFQNISEAIGYKARH
jgi:dihydroorotate dehydrogenase